MDLDRSQCDGGAEWVKGKRAGVACAAAAALGVVLAPSLASAQGAPPPPPPGYEQAPPDSGTAPPPGYGPPPPGYGAAPPPGYYPGYTQPEMLGPKTMDYEEGDPIPPGYHRETSIRKGLVIGGAVTFGTLYLVSALTAAAVSDLSGGEDFVPLYIPVAGPFVTIGTSDAPAGGAVLLAVDGVAQAGGLAMLILGLAVPRDELVRNDVGGTDLRLTPVFGKDAASNTWSGLGVAGSL